LKKYVFHISKTLGESNKPLRFVKNYSQSNAMHDMTYKYQLYLENIPDCPPENYSEINKSAFRWLHEEIDNDNNFKPVLLQSPKRALNMNHLNKCKGYGLSLFNTANGAIERYLDIIASKPNLIETFGNSLGEISLTNKDGVGSEPETNNNGHFTFHEYENTDLTKKIIKFAAINKFLKLGK
jgi:hypothetical protein